MFHILIGTSRNWGLKHYSKLEAQHECTENVRQAQVGFLAIYL